MLKKFFKTQTQTIEQPVEIDAQNIPNHIGIIMDGNGRWAQKKHLPRVAGHKEGMETVRKITMAANSLGVKVLTLYAFSTENWKRPETEVRFLMDLPVRFFDKFVPELIENNIKVNVMGYVDDLPESTREAIFSAMDKTSHNTGMILNFALNYGSRAELVTAVQQIAQDIHSGKLSVNAICEETISQNLMTNDLAPYNDPELLIRTSGEQRLSNFLLWQVAYSEFVFSDVYWPDYSDAELVKNIVTYQQRNRRFGGLKEKDKGDL